MSKEVIFYKLNVEFDWRFGGFVDSVQFDFANFRLENPNGDILLIDLDQAAAGGERVTEDISDRWKL